MITVGAIKFSIPPLSPDFNPKENILKIFPEKQFMKHSMFHVRVKHTIENTSTKNIDKTIESMLKTMLIVIKSKGRRIKY